jgi:hypothetical protein
MKVPMRIHEFGNVLKIHLKTRSIYCYSFSDYQKKINSIERDEVEDLDFLESGKITSEAADPDNWSAPYMSDIIERFMKNEFPSLCGHHFRTIALRIDSASDAILKKLLNSGYFLDARTYEKLISIGKNISKK